MNQADAGSSPSDESAPPHVNEYTGAAEPHATADKGGAEARVDDGQTRAVIVDTSFALVIEESDTSFARPSSLAAATMVMPEVVAALWEHTNEYFVATWTANNVKRVANKIVITSYRVEAFEGTGDERRLVFWDALRIRSYHGVRLPGELAEAEYQD